MLTIVSKPVAEIRTVLQVLKDFLILTKPVVVVLLLVTTLTGMVVAAGHLPDAASVFWVLLGGTMAASGPGGGLTDLKINLSDT